MLLNERIVASSSSIDKTKESKNVSYTSMFRLETFVRLGLIWSTILFNTLRAFI
jgi:hypothetical protein